MPFFYDRRHYTAIALSLLAGDIQSRVLTNNEVHSVEVKLDNGAIVLWSNTLDRDNAKPVWRCSIVSAEGDVEAYATNLPFDALPDDVARMIATYEYLGALEQVR